MAKALTDWDSRIGRRLTLRDLHILSSVARWGSMAKAASHLSTTQSVVSDAIANLESALGVRLLDRSAKGVEPTVYAKTLLKRTDVVFDELRAGVKDIEALASSTSGEVRIACPEFLAGGLIPDAVDGFSRLYPDIVCRVTDVDSTTLEFRQLQERSADLMVARVPASFSDDDLSVEILFDDPHVIVVGADSPWAGRRSVTLADLAGEPWIIPASLIVRDILAEAFEAERLKVPDGRIVSSFVLMRNHLLATGRFLTVLPVSVLQYNARQWGLRALPIKLGGRPRPIAIVMLKNRSVSPSVRLFVEHLRGTAKSYLRGRT
ncbi:MAG TPA: LysR family transcriptional regulator [Pseudolabrys sp.]|nr:LysR family transcriptional regulator [Pseudolabrys sp.]